MPVVYCIWFLFYYSHLVYYTWFPSDSDDKESAYNARDSGSIPGSGRSPWRRESQPPPVFLPGEAHRRGFWWATVHGITKSQTRLTEKHSHSILNGLRCGESVTIKEKKGLYKRYVFKLTSVNTECVIPLGLSGEIYGKDLRIQGM